MGNESNKRSGLKSFYFRIAPYRVTFFLLLLLVLIFAFIILVSFIIPPVPVPEAFVTDPNWLIPTIEATATETPVPTPTQTPIPTPTPRPTVSEDATATIEGEFFFDDFESGDLQTWTLIKTGPGAVAEAQDETVWQGNYAVHLSVEDNLNSHAYLRTSLQSPQPELWISGYFMIQQEGPDGSNVPLFRLFNSSGERLITFYRQNLSKDQIWIGYEDKHYQTYGILPLNTWSHLKLHIIAAGEGTSTIEAYVNDSLIYETNTASLDQAGILLVQIGNETLRQVFDLIADDIRITK